ncbi:MAG: lactoylglutathione lyase [Bacteroidetes bacterium CG_4_9_14_3_um_filter_41_19]|nr:MAG: lactoylglutathione lyase [Bacteroidetes bacterium CG_4_9_14_3_um_filter_41_19]
MKVHHVGYAVSDMEKSVLEFEALGYTKSGILIHDVSRKVSIQMLKNGPWEIELIAPLSAESPINNILNKNNNTPYHFCYCTASIEKTIHVLRSKKYVLIEPASPAMAFNGHLAAFLYHPNIGLIELLECN